MPAEAPAGLLLQRRLPAAVSGGVRAGGPRNQPPGGDCALVIAAPLRDVDATVSELTRDEVIIGVLVLALVGGLAYCADRRGHAPAGADRGHRRPRSRPATCPGGSSRPTRAPRSAASGSP